MPRYRELTLREKLLLTIVALWIIVLAIIAISYETL
jgi:cell division protein FtsL